MSSASVSNTAVYYIEHAISALEGMSNSPEKYPPLHPAHNPKRLQQLCGLLESMRSELHMVTWPMLFAVPYREIVITVPDQVNGVQQRMAILERYLCANSALTDCVELDPATLQPEKLYTMEVDRSAHTHNTFFISHKSHEPRLSVISDWQYQQIPPHSNNYQTVITYYCSFIDEAIEFIDDTEANAVSTSTGTVDISAPYMSVEETTAMLSQNISKRGDRP